MSVRKRRLKSGRTVYDAVLEHGTGPDGRRLRETRTFATRREAEEADRRAKDSAHAMAERSGRLTLSEYIDRCYWPIASRRLSATSLDTYERDIEKRIRPALGSMRLDRIDRYAIQSMVDSAPTRSVGRKALATLKTILGEAVGDGFIAANPARARYALPPEGGKRDDGTVLTDFAQIGEFVSSVLSDAPEPIARLVLTGLLLGLRPEERYALDHEDIDFANRVVYVTKAYVTVSGKRGGHVLKMPKTDLSRRSVPMPQRFVDFVYWEPGGSGPYIANARGGRLSPSTAQKQWRRYLDAHPSLPRVTLENMRHSYATSCLHAGMEVADLSRILGHSDINTTYRRYVRPSFSDMQRSMVSIDAIVR